MTEEVKAVCIVLGALAIGGLIYWRMVKADKADAGTGALEEMRERLAAEEANGATVRVKLRLDGADEVRAGLRKVGRELRAIKPPKPQTSKSAPKRKPSKKAKLRKKA